MNSRRIVVLTLMFITVALVMTGCGGGTRPVSMDHWHSSVQKYVVEQGNGDMNSLREIEVAPNRPGFRIFSRDLVEESEDIAGVLVGAHEFGGRVWHLYLVGQVQQGEVQSIHLAAVAHDGAQFQWRSGVSDATALAKYREAHQSATGGTMQFPAPADVFEWQGQGDMITLREKTSGAEWTLDLAGEMREARGQ